MELRDRRALLIDTETTGFDSEKNQLLEVGILVLENGEILSKLNIKIKHKEYTITGKAMATNKINIVEHEKEALEVKEAADEILKFLEENKNSEHYICIGQNIDFDIKFLEKLFLSTYKIKDFRNLVGYRKLDIMQLFLIRNIEGKVKAEKQDLDYILKELDIVIPENRHSALTDCLLEYEALKKLLY